MISTHGTELVALAPKNDLLRKELEWATATAMMSAPTWLHAAIHVYRAANTEACRQWSVAIGIRKVTP